MLDGTIADLSQWFGLGDNNSNWIQPTRPDRLAILDVGTAQVQAIDLAGATYRSLAVGPRTGSVYLLAIGAERRS